jgi:formylmethanofuran dehydrogenase subunit C
MSSTRVDDIKSDGIYQCEGNLVIDGNVGKNAKVIVSHGSLEIKGNIEDGAIIQLITNSTKSHSQRSYHDGDMVVIFGSTESFNIEVRGSVGNNVKISTLMGQIKIDGNAGDFVQIQTSNSKIEVTNIGASCRLITTNAKITANDIDQSSTLITTNASIHANNVGPKCRLVTTNGSISVNSADQSASMVYTNGAIYVNGKVTSKSKSNFSSNVTFIGSNFQTRVVNVGENSELLNESKKSRSCCFGLINFSC